METLRYILLANGLLAVVSLAYYVLLRRETFFGANRLALWAGLAASLGLPLLELPDWRPQPVKTVMQRTAQVIVPKVLPDSPALLPDPNAAVTGPGSEPYPATQQPAFVWSWVNWLVRIYGAGVLLLLIRFAFQLASLKRLIRQSAHEPYDDFTLVRNGQITSPFSFFGWVVLNPDYHEPAELEQILRHERVHVRERHSIDMIAAELLCIGLWFNPAAYLFRYLLHQTLEFGADRAVLAEGVDAKAYQYNLVKVSLAGGRPDLTNHFSKSQLKSRIVMLNKPESSRTTWLKYPVLGIATLMVVATFARPSAQTLKRYVPAPVAATIASVISPVEEITGPVTLTETSARLATTKQVPAQASKPQTDVLPVVTVDSVANTAGPDSARTSPSRYIIYKPDYLCWLITPKTPIEDLAILKQEMAKHGYKLTIKEIKYDQNLDYIYALDYTILDSSGAGSGSTHPPSVKKGPITNPCGILGIGTKKGQSYGGASLVTRINPKTDRIPAELKRVAIEDSIYVARQIQNAKMEELISAGKRKYGHLGIGPRRFNKEEIVSINKSDPNSHLSIDSNGFLSVAKAVDFVKVFINNEPRLADDIRQIHIDKLYALAVIYGPESAVDKRAGTRYMLFYVSEDN